MSSLVIQTSFLGDVILATPLIAELGQRGDVDVLTTPQGGAILANNPAIRRVIVYDRRASDTGVRGFLRTARRLRSVAGPGGNRGTQSTGAADPYEAVYLAQGSVRSALLAIAAGIGERVGFDTSDGRHLYTRRVRYRPDRHHAERLWWLSMSDCADPPQQSQISPRLYPSHQEAVEIDRLLEDSPLDQSRPFVALAPGSVWGTKRWPFYPELAAMIAREMNVIVIGGTDDIAAADTIVAQLPPGTAISAAGKLSLLASAGLIGRARALVGNDSAPQHLASAMGTPTLTIFGPTVPAFGFGPLADGSTSAGREGLACRPCNRHGPQRCPLGHWRCMRELSSGEVFEHLTATLANRAIR
ncbi:MAG: glycosyltransferase family 9 protein [Gemmatimonadota bacterium]|nr:glycosyltransferase family 9 protein [Gemmatimonadota bacterium]